jgi:hypothetical protein
MNATGLAEFLAILEKEFPFSGESTHAPHLALREGQLTLYVFIKRQWVSFKIDDGDLQMSPQQLAGDIIALLQAPTNSGMDG